MWFSKKQRVYLDYASAPPVLPEAEKAVQDASRYIGNPGAIHADGVQAAAALEDARERVARMLSVKPREIIFTSGLTEANNLAILGTARSLERTKRSLEGTHWIVSSIEHTSVLDCFGEIERLGGTVSHIEPTEKGIIEPEAVAQALTPETVLVSVGWANNEIGTIQPLRKIREVLDSHEKAYGTTVLLHADAGQAPLYIASTAHTLGVDLLSLGGNKLYGPHGVGALYISNRAGLVRTIQGGPQESGLRPGTESVALALGFAAAYESVAARREKEARRLQKIQSVLAQNISAALPDAVINGDANHMLPHMLNISIPHIQSEYLTLQLDQKGFAVSTKSACREGEEQESHVVAALSGDAWRAKNTIRISMGRDTRDDDMRRFVEVLSALVQKKA